MSYPHLKSNRTDNFYPKIVFHLLMLELSDHRFLDNFRLIYMTSELVVWVTDVNLFNFFNGLTDNQYYIGANAMIIKL